MRTRIAPTPSGYLHRGNALNFEVVNEYARIHGLDLVLRIDDSDVERTRPEYLADISRVLNWLEITPSHVRTTTDVQRYRDALDQLPWFACRCSRAEHACRCTTKSYPLVTGESAAKLRLAGTDVVLWRRDGVPAYHLVNVVEDEHLQISHVIRGEDLRESSTVHAELAKLLDFAAPTYLHHALVTDEHGEKLSKSTLRSGEPMVCDAGTREWVRTHARSLELS